MSPLLLSFLLGMFLFAAESRSSPNDQKEVGCEINQHHVISSIGAVIDQSSRVGKEQRTAMEMAVHDFNRRTHCSKLDLHFQDSPGNSARAASAVIDLVNKKQAHAILGALTFQEAALAWEFDEVTKDIPIISLTPSAAPPPLLPSQHPSFIRMSYDVTVQMQCLAAIVGHFRWRKVIAIYERSSSFSADSALVTYLSDSVQAVDSAVDHHSAFPIMNSLLDSENFIEEELKRLRSKNVKVFTILRSSLEFAIILFKKAKELGMMTKGYAWIVSDDFANLLDSVESSVTLNNMEGVIGFKTKYLDTTESFRAFERRFRRKYRLKHPEEEKFSSPSIYALRAYDATWAIAKAMQNSEGKANSSTFTRNILTSNFEGLSGEINFKNAALLQKPVFQVVNVIGRSYRQIALWTLQFGFSEDLTAYDRTRMRLGNGLVGDLSSIYWPGGELRAPKGVTFGSMEKPLRIGVPARGAFTMFVNVTYDHNRNETAISGFSIEVFEAVVQQLPYHLPYILVPHYGTYDEMVVEVHNKVFPKGSPLAIDISEAILKITQSGAMNQLEKRLSSSSNCSLTEGDKNRPGGFGIEPFFLLFLISGVLLAITFLNSMARLMGRQFSIHEYIQESLARRRIYGWASLTLAPLWTGFRSEFFREGIFCKSNNEMKVTLNEMQASLKAIELATNHQEHINTGE